jgi:hypothetical protein
MLSALVEQFAYVFSLIQVPVFALFTNDTIQDGLAEICQFIADGLPGEFDITPTQRLDEQPVRLFHRFAKLP